MLITDESGTRIAIESDEPLTGTALTSGGQNNANLHDKFEELIQGVGSLMSKNLKEIVESNGLSSAKVETAVTFSEQLDFWVIKAGGTQSIKVSLEYRKD